MAALRRQIAYLRPVLTGTQPSVGLGDRLGLATPGHIAAGRDSGFVLVLAQQSIREMNRTARTPQQVMDEATFGVFECGYDAGFGGGNLRVPMRDRRDSDSIGFCLYRQVLLPKV